MARPRRLAPVLPFLVHQVFDYLIGLYLLQEGSRIGGRAGNVCYALGALVIVGATFSGRPLGGGPVSRRAHRLVDLVLLVAVAASPFAFGLTGETSTVVRMEVVAVGMAVLAKVTSYIHPEYTAREIARGLKKQAPRAAGQFVGKRLSGKNRPPGSP